MMRGNRQIHQTPIQTGICCTEVNIRFPGAMLILISVTFATNPVRADDALLQLLQEHQCSQCQLADADLVHADLRDADLSEARLIRANLSRAQLDGANLRGADLSFTSLRGASLRGADLSKTRLYGTDLREADLTGARLDADALEQTHWQGAKGIANGVLNHAALHNAGVEAFTAGNWSSAEMLFSDAIRSQPQEPLSWVARGISRNELAKDDLSAADFRYAASLYEQQGSREWAEQLEKAADAVSLRRFKDETVNEGKGMGSQLLQSTITGLRMIAPIAAKALIPLGLGF